MTHEQWVSPETRQACELWEDEVALNHDRHLAAMKTPVLLSCSSEVPNEEKEG